MIGCKEIYVSRYHGDSSPSCGKTIHTACKTIALAITQAQWNDTIYIDGTETSRDPYPCLPMTSYPEGVYVNTSLSIERFGKGEVFVSCSSKRQMRFDGRNISKKVLIRLKGLTFLNSHITVQKCLLYVERCLFKDAIPFPSATAVVNFETFEEQVSLTIQNTRFSNNAFPCIRVVGSRAKIEVYDTVFQNNTAIWEGTTGVNVAVFMVALPTKGTGSPESSITLTNTSFVRNMAPFGGSFNIQASSENIANRKMVKRFKNITNRSCASKSCSSRKHDTRQSPKELVTVNITDGQFFHNFGGSVTLSSVSVVNIFIARSDFVNNSSPLVGGALLFQDVREFLLHIVDSNFIENSAKNGGSAACVMGISSKVSILVQNVLFLRNVLHEPEFIADFPNGGTLTVVMDEGYLKILLRNISFLCNKAARGSSTLHSEGNFQDITIVDSSFLGNSQDKWYSHDWKILLIFSFRLNFTLIRTVIYGNHAKPRADNNTLIGQPIHFFLSGLYLAQINISGLQYKNNKGGGMFIQLGENNKVKDKSTLFLNDTNFEKNQLFSLEIRVMSNSFLRMKSLVFRANTFVSSILECLALFFLFVLAEGNKISMENATFENNTHVRGRIVLFRLPPDKKDPYACDIPKWVYKNYVGITKVLFRENNDQHSTVLRLENGWNILSNCRFLDNSGTHIGSNLFVGEGSASLELINTSFELTHNSRKAQIPPDFRGLIYIASSGPIKLKNTLLLVKEFQDIDSYLTVTASSKTDIDNSSVIRCPVGTLRTFSNFSHVHFVENEACPGGLYISRWQSFTFSCKRCPPGFYSIKPFGDRCRPCPYGGNCTSNIAAKPTYWGFPSLRDRGSISFQQCPIDYCCPYQNISCPYDNHRYLSNGCSGNRTGFLCGECKPGFTETLFSARCRASKDCNDYWFWPVASLYTLAFGLFLLWRNPIVCFVKRLFPWKSSRTQPRHSASDSASDGGGYIKVVFYFYQIASLVFMSQDIEIYLGENYLLDPVIGWFDFKAVSSNEGLICPIRGLTVVSKIFLGAFQVFAVLFGILVIFLVHGAARKLQKQSPAFPPSGQYLAATIDCLLLGYSTLARTALKALNCVPIQSSSRLFYDGNIQCWQWWQKLCVVFVCVFIIPFVYVLYRGSKLLHGKVISLKSFLYACLLPLPFAFRWMISCKRIPHSETETRRVSDEQPPLLPPDHSTREKSFHNPTHDVIYGPFKQSDDGQGSGAVYWESVLIGRRLILISLHTFIVFPFIRMVCLSVACALILAHHLWKKPFKDPRVNHGETASLTALLVLAVINMTEVTFAISGESPSEKERICFTVLHVVEVIVLGIVPLAFILIIFVSVLWQLLKFCKLLVNVWKLFLK